MASVQAAPDPCELVTKRILIFGAIIVGGILLIEAGCATSDDPGKRKKRALMGGATSTALGVATGVGGPVLAARAALGAASRVVTGEAIDTIKEKDGEEANAPVVDDDSVKSK